MKAKVFTAASKVLKVASGAWHTLGTQSAFICEQSLRGEHTSLYLVCTGALVDKGEATQTGEPPALWAELPSVFQQSKPPL